MLDSAIKRAALIDHLESALGLSEELSESITGYLIERALDEARAGQILGKQWSVGPRR
jgi:hypothetical protein